MNIKKISCFIDTQKGKGKKEGKKTPALCIQNLPLYTEEEKGKEVAEGR